MRRDSPQKSVLAAIETKCGSVARCRAPSSGRHAECNCSGERDAAVRHTLHAPLTRRADMRGRRGTMTTTTRKTGVEEKESSPNIGTMGGGEGGGRIGQEPDGLSWSRQIRTRGRGRGTEEKGEARRTRRWRRPLKRCRRPVLAKERGERAANDLEHVTHGSVEGRRGKEDR